jgi:hypothetical protein
VPRAIRVGLVVWLLCGAARAALRTCVDVQVSGTSEPGVLRLVELELDRFPSHVRVEQGCSARLTVEVMDVGGERVLTARVDGEVPFRTEVHRGELVKAVAEALRVVLHNDPRDLRGPRDRGWLGERVAELRLEGQGYYGLEFAQTMALVGGEVQSLAGATVTARREAGRFALGVRVSGASSFNPGAQHLELTQQFLAHVELIAYSNASEPYACFAALTGGFELQRFRGPSPWDDAPGLHTAQASGLSATVSVGIELFRLHDMRAASFVQADFPVFASRDIDDGVVDQWTPSTALGVGVAF